MNEEPMEITVHTDPMYGTAAIHATQRFGGVAKRAAIIPVNSEMLTDCGPSLPDLLRPMLDRALRPWAYPDRAWRIPFDPFPRWTRITRWLRDRRDRSDTV